MALQVIHGESSRLINALVGEPAYAIPAGRIISASSNAAALSVYAGKDSNAEDARFQGGELFVVLGAPVSLEWEALKFATSAVGTKKYFPVIKLSSDLKEFEGEPVWVRVEESESMRKTSPRFVVESTYLTLKSVLEIRGKFNMGDDAV